MSELIEIEVDIKEETEFAYYLSHKSSNPQWVAKYLIQDYTVIKNGSITHITIPRWLAAQKMFI